MPRLSKVSESERKIRARWLRTGCCVVCGKKRAKTKKRTDGSTLHRGSKRFCRYHLETNRKYQRTHRASVRNAA